MEDCKETKNQTEKMRKKTRKRDELTKPQKKNPIGEWGQQRLM